MKDKIKKILSWLLSRMWGIMEMLFVAIIPLIVVYLGYGGWGTKAYDFKIGFGVLVFFVILFFIIKRVWLSKWLNAKRIESANLSALKKAETDVRKLEQINYELKKLLIIENAINWVLPLSFLAVGFAAAYALEKSLVTFTEILAFVGISETIGCGISFVCIWNKK
jgi:hypothetical protein